MIRLSLKIYIQNHFFALVLILCFQVFSKSEIQDEVFHSIFHNLGTDGVHLRAHLQVGLSSPDAAHGLGLSPPQQPGK